MNDNNTETQLETGELAKKVFSPDYYIPPEKYYDYLLKQYEIFVNTAEKVSDRRANTHKFCITILSAIMALYSYDNSIIKCFCQTCPWFLPLFGLIIVIIWSYNINSYKLLNKVKFDNIINEIEKQLPFPCFTHEWEMLGKNNFKTFSSLEMFYPLIFGGLFVVLIIITNWNYIIEGINFILHLFI